MRLSAVGFAVLFALQQPQPPALLVQALKAEPELTLVGTGGGASWLVRDLDGDKRDDVAAAVMKKTPRGSEYGVIAIHAAAPDMIHWVIPLDIDAIHGVAAGNARDTVVPVFCQDCDTDIWFRWGGEEYEAELFAAGERVELGTETQADIPLYASPNLASRPAASVPHCTTATVQKVGGTPDARWYFVETADGEQGWVPSRTTSTEYCVG